MNISKSTLGALEKLNFHPLFYDNFMNIVPVEKATYLYVGFFEGNFINKKIKTPKKEITLSWLLDKINSNNDSYINFTKYMEKFLDNKNYAIYATSYGIGVFSLSKNIKKCETEIESILKKKGIDYSFGLSDAGWVYRIIISKSKHNIDILSNL